MIFCIPLDLFSYVFLPRSRGVEDKYAQAEVVSAVPLHKVRRKPRHYGSEVLPNEWGNGFSGKLSLVVHRVVVSDSYKLLGVGFDPHHAHRALPDCEHILSRLLIWPVVQKVFLDVVLLKQRIERDHVWDVDEHRAGDDLYKLGEVCLVKRLFSVRVRDLACE